MLAEDKEVELQAVAYAKKHKTKLARQLTDKTIYAKERDPVSVFMCGSPGAGKTESSKIFLKEIGSDSVIRLDPDDLRCQFPGYNGSNSYLFQRAISVVIERALDFAFQGKQSFLLDGTLSKLDIAEKNIQRCLDRKRSVLILFVYQSPAMAWEFVQAREKEEGRRILPETFIEQFLGAQEVVRKLKRKFGGRIQVDLLVKNNRGHTRFYHDNVTDIENLLAEKFTRNELEQLIT
ncbi:zeta toxin family protein [Idiomarina aquatica]|uniref:Zeta toxin n=1 Tax=Idiomarina aquatica TaxID=1327752 RepID=A0AA94JDP1_9GAMM|nr:zeta toxin family protein [Idiomarina aquatica]RUO43430.1 Zeta toxin [Idiomarina aquatica]